jgi:protein-disulfide isomerase/uncharacterized membrane protein
MIPGIGKNKERIPAPEGKPYFVGKGPFLILLALALIGIFATGYLTYRHIALTAKIATVGKSFLCRASGKINCDAILLTDYAVLFGYVSSAALGLMGFVFVLWTSLIAVFRQGLRKIALAALVVYFFGAIGFSWYFLYLLVFKVEHICTWCIVAHVINFVSLIMVLSLAIIKRKEFLLEEIVSYTEQACFILAGGFLALTIFFAATAVEKQLSFQTAKADYEEIANDPVVILAMIANSPTYDLKIEPDDPVLGNRDSKTPLFFFSDYQCSVCARTHVFFKDLVRHNPRKLCLVFKNFPLSSKCNRSILEEGGYHPHSCLAAKAAQSVYLVGGLDKFLQYGNMLYENRKRLDEKLLMDLAAQLGIDMVEFKALLKDGSPADKKVLKDIEQGIDLKIFATPRVLFLGKKLPVDYQGEALISLMEQMVRAEKPELGRFDLRRPPNVLAR